MLTIATLIFNICRILVYKSMCTVLLSLISQPYQHSPCARLLGLIATYLLLLAHVCSGHDAYKTLDA